MQKCMAVLLTAFLLLGMTACGGEPGDSSVVDSTPDSVTSDTSVDANTTTNDAIGEGSTELNLEKMLDYQFSSSDYPDTRFRMQGGCFDGTYFYFAFVPYPEDTWETTYIVVLDKKGTEVRRSKPLGIGHANSLSLLEDGQTILVSFGNASWYYLVDKDTLTVTYYNVIGENFLSIDYCLETDEYAMMSDGYGEEMTHLIMSDTYGGDTRNLYYSLKIVKRVKLDREPGDGAQNFFCTKDVLYSVGCRWEGEYVNYLYLFNWEGERLGFYLLDEIPGEFETQSATVIGDTIYIACSTVDGYSRVYRGILP